MEPDTAEYQSVGSIRNESTNSERGITSQKGEGANPRRRTMALITKWYVRASEFSKGQTMTEYALILSAVAVVVFAGYQTMGSDITSLLTTIDGKL